MIILYFLLILLSSFWLMKACDPFEESANYLGRNLSHGIKGATINAVASSTPELFTTLIFLFIFNDKAGFLSGIATIAGSAIFNAMVIPAISIFAVTYYSKNKVILSKHSLLRDSFFFILSELILVYLLSLQRLGFGVAALLMMIYLCYVFYMFIQQRNMKKKNSISKEKSKSKFLENKRSRFTNFLAFDFRNMLHPNKEFTNKTAIYSLIISVLHVTAACYLMAECIIKIAEHYSMGTFFVACIAAAVGTSIPDSIISFKDAKKGNYDDAISNAIGSNIFDVCVCLGLPLLLFCIFYGPIEMKIGQYTDELRVLLLFVTIFIVILLTVPKSVGSGISFILMFGYILFIVYVWCRGMGYEWAVSIGKYINFFRYGEVPL